MGGHSGGVGAFMWCRGAFRWCREAFMWCRGAFVWCSEGAFSSPIHISPCQPQISYHPTSDTPYPIPHSSPFSLQLLTCWALIPFVYCVSFFFKSGLIAFCVIVLYFLFSSQVCGRLWESCWCTCGTSLLLPLHFSLSSPSLFSPPPSTDI